MIKGLKPSPYIIEFTAALERTLAFAYAGNARVLSRGLMQPMWLSQSLIDVGSPCIAAMYLCEAAPSKRSIQILTHLWPCDRKSQYPQQASKASQIFNYGQEHYSVSLCAPRQPTLG
jgi:hypothetical protein